MESNAGLKTPLLGPGSHVNSASIPVSGRRSDAPGGERAAPDGPAALAPLAPRTGTFVDRASEFLTLQVGGSEGRNIAQRLGQCFVSEPGKDHKGEMFLGLDRLRPADREPVMSQIGNPAFQDMLSAHAASEGHELRYIVTFSRSGREPAFKTAWQGEPSKRWIDGGGKPWEEIRRQENFIEGVAQPLAEILGCDLAAARDFARDVLRPNIQVSEGFLGASPLIGALTNIHFCDMRPVLIALQARAPGRAYETLLAIESNPTISRHVFERGGSYPIRTVIPMHPLAVSAAAPGGAVKARIPHSDGDAGV